MMIFLEAISKPVRLVSCRQPPTFVYSSVVSSIEIDNVARSRLRKENSKMASVDVTIRNYKPKDHDVVKRMFAFGIEEHVSYAFKLTLNGSKPKSLALHLAIFALGSYLFSSPLYGLVFWSGYGLIIWALITYQYFDYVAHHLDTDMKDLELIYWTTEPNEYLVAVNKDDDVIGCVSFREISHNTIELHRLSVTENGRGRGLGRRLIEAVIEAGRRKGYENLYLETSDPQAGPIRLYERMNFIRLNETKPTQHAPAIVNWAHGIVIICFNMKL